MTLAYAESRCQRHGLHAFETGETGARCSFGPGTVMGHVTNYQCVP
jgi:hypothetical protein